MTEPEQKPKYEGSHFTPDIICPFCHKEHKRTCQRLYWKVLANVFVGFILLQLRTGLKILKD